MVTGRINERQRALLERIADGREPVTSSEHWLATTVYALRGRKLVRTVRTAGGWSAEITEEGRYYLAHGHPMPQGSAGRVSKVTGRTTATRVGPAPALRIEPTDLVKRLVDAAGTLVIKDPDAPTRSAWRSAIHRAVDAGLVPQGQVLRHAGRDHGDLTILLVASEDTETALTFTPILVSDRLVRPHPAVVSLRDAPDRLRVSRAERSRALRLLDALFKEAERRGHVATPLTDRGDAVATVAVDGHAYPVQIRELATRTPHVPTTQELAQKQRSPWMRIAEYDYLPNGELQISLDSSGRGRPTAWADRQRWRLDDRLAHVLAEIEARAVDDEERRLDRQRQEDERRKRHREAIRRAYARLIEHNRASALRAQVDAWSDVSNIRDYCAAIRATHHDSASRTSSEESWLIWAEAYADGIDPLRRSVTGPDDPPPDAQALRPFLDGWSPYLDNHEPLRSVLGLQPDDDND
ncbi:MAG: hypothetical protein QOE45_279 [Frankiaceae bacterium]|nr:hypothetical protein [Frankiaceae bacterium]